MGNYRGPAWRMEAKFSIFPKFSKIKKPVYKYENNLLLYIQIITHILNEINKPIQNNCRGNTNVPDASFTWFPEGHTQGHHAVSTCIVTLGSAMFFLF